jgi:hypothetical protein
MTLFVSKGTYLPGSFCPLAARPHGFQPKWRGRMILMTSGLPRLLILLLPLPYPHTSQAVEGQTQILSLLRTVRLGLTAVKPKEQDYFDGKTSA